MILSNGYEETISNLKVLEFVPSLSALREFFISSHLELTSVDIGAPNPSALGVGYVLDCVGEYGWFCWVYCGRISVD